MPGRPPLAQRNPTAFGLLVDLTETPRIVVDVPTIVGLTGVSPEAAAAVAGDLVAEGALTPATPDVFVVTTDSTDRRPVRRECAWCSAPLTGRQRLFCTKDCANRTHNARIAARTADQRAVEARSCVACGTALEPRPRARHQLYCSRPCEYRAKGR